MQPPSHPLTYSRSPSPIPIALTPPPRIRLPTSPTRTPSPSFNYKNEPSSTYSAPQTATHPPDYEAPIPWNRLGPLILFPVADAMTYAVLFPIVTDMITSFGTVAPDQIGLYAGLGEGVMMLVEAVAAPTWAKLADKYGRRITLLIGFSVCAMVCPLLGFSSAVWQIVLWRSCLGLNSGGVVTRIMAAELSHPTNRARIFSILSPSFSIGMLLGTFLGGELAHPHDRLPSWLGGQQTIWEKHPWGLPCLIVGIVDAIVVLIGYFTLVETRPPTKSSAHNNAAHEKPKRNQFLDCFKVPSFILLTAVFLLFQVSTFSWDGLYTVYTYTQPDKGGLGLPVDAIGLLYSAGYLVSFILNPVFLPKMQKRFGAVKSLSMVLAMWTVLGVMIPMSQWTAANARWLMWVVLFVQLGLRAVGSFGWALCDVLTLSCFDDYPELMASGSAISLIGGAGGRAFGPALAGWLFSISTQYPTGSLLRQTSWIYIVAVTIPAVILVRFVPDNASWPAKEDYEAVPMLETDAEGRASMGGSSDLRARTSAVEV